jgi:hypothetical protein
MVYEIIINYFKQINLFYNKTGLHWHVVENHFWIELHINRAINSEWQKGYSTNGLKCPEPFKRNAIIADKGIMKVRKEMH